MSILVSVYCPECRGDGSHRANGLVCGVCLGQGHIHVDRDLDGTVPPGMTEWVDQELPPIPSNPLRLTQERRA